MLQLVDELPLVQQALAEVRAIFAEPLLQSQVAANKNFCIGNAFPIDFLTSPIFQKDDESLAATGRLMKSVLEKFLGKVWFLLCYGITVAA